jgi:hypothetical protein
MNMYKRYTLIFILPALAAILMLSGCGTLTGIPGHGGGKRFAVEQELVAAATRSAIRQVDTHSLKGKKINLFVNTIGDSGAGNLTGGRLTLASQLRGDYLVSAPEITKSLSNGAEVRQDGMERELAAGVVYEGLGAYHNSEEIPSSDLQYLAGLLEAWLYIRGVHPVPPSEAEVDIYVTVDVFGTVRTRVDWFLANNEILRAKTALEIMAVDHMTGELVMAPVLVSSQAEYNEQYILWAGPVSVKKMLKKSDPLLCDFTDADGASDTAATERVREEKLDYPFRYEMEKRNRKGGGKMKK